MGTVHPPPATKANQSIGLPGVPEIRETPAPLRAKGYSDCEHPRFGEQINRRKSTPVAWSKSGPSRTTRRKWPAVPRLAVTWPKGSALKAHPLVQRRG